MNALTIIMLTSLPAADPSEADARRTAERGLSFLEKSSTAWREERKCVTCHQVPFTLWAMNEARGRGFAVDGAKLDGMTKWAFEFCTTNENKGEKTGGFHLT